MVMVGFKIFNGLIVNSLSQCFDGSKGFVKENFASKVGHFEIVINRLRERGRRALWRNGGGRRPTKNRTSCSSRVDENCRCC